MKNAITSPAEVACRAVAGGQFLRSCSLPSRRCFQCLRHGSTCHARQRRRPAVVTDHPDDSRCPARLRAPTSCRLGHDRLSVRPGPVRERSRLGCGACCPCSGKKQERCRTTVRLGFGRARRGRDGAQPRWHPQPSRPVRRSSRPDLRRASRLNTCDPGVMPFTAVRSHRTIRR